MSTLPRLFLKPLRPERYGHPWIFAGEVARGPEPAVDDGSWVQIVDHNGKLAGAGYYNGRSKIVGRRMPLVTTEAGEALEPGQKWWTERIRAAHDYRNARGVTARGMYRLVHGEADGLPGLIVDVYGPFVVAQFLTLGVDLRRAEIVRALTDVLGPAGIYERSDSATRKLEGLSERVGVLSGDEPPDRLDLDDDAKILVDIKRGGKTGLFLDQLENQRVAAREARGRSVLNVFSYTGLFGLRAALAGARSVEDVESSDYYLTIARAQWDANIGAIRGCKYKQTIGNAFDELRIREESGDRVGMVVLDPPAFTKARASAEAALRGYNEINRRAMRILEPNGVLVTCSCSHHISFDEFESVILASAKDAKREVRIIERRGQPADHPILLRVPETEYLKVLILAVG